MSTASRVPETYKLTGDEAYDTLKRARVWLLMRDAFKRFRFADGFSHGRAMAFQVVLAVFSGAIVLIALALTLHSSTLAAALRESARSQAPGPTAELFERALTEGERNGGSGRVAALIFGSLAMLIAGASAMGQVERAANRIYGIEADRPIVQKYRLAVAMALTAGTLSVVYFILFTAGSDWTENVIGSRWRDSWTVLRWPVSILFLTVSVSVVFKASPRRRQPGFSWLAVGAGIAVIASLTVSLLLRAYIQASKSFGSTYGPLAGFMGVMLWAYLSAVTLFYGLAFAAQLEAVRAGVDEPRSETKRRQSEPESSGEPETSGKY
jgi:YihY family inner membrane protein